MSAIVLVSKFIKASALSFCYIALSSTAVQARDLTPAERSVCTSLSTCVDIVSRLDASEFDYTTLEVEFRRFGVSGKAALFTLLESDEGHADMARLILPLGPLTQLDRRRIQTKWTQKKAEVYLPFLLDGHPMSRDLLLQSLAHPKVGVRETARVALLRLPQSARTAPLPKPVQTALLKAVQNDPMNVAAPYIARLNPAGYEVQFAGFLRSGNASLVTASYGVLFRKSPAEAFNTLLAEMGRIDTPAQAQALGEMLAVRHRSRPDGFYLKFAKDMSGDPKLPLTARASGLHAVLTIADGAFPDLTAERSQALSFLASGQSVTAQNQYLPYLKKVRADAAMDLIWDIAQKERWGNRESIAEFFDTHKSSSKVIAGLLQSNDARSFLAGLRRAKPVHERLIQAQFGNPVTAISSAARQKLNLKAPQNSGHKCSIIPFDLADKRNQMPFFDSGWMVGDDRGRVSLTRAELTTAHPTGTGWLAGYNLDKARRRSKHTGGALLQYDNKSGAFQAIGDFSGPLAVLPNTPLRLGQTTDSFWVIDQWDTDTADLSAYKLDLKGTASNIRHISVLPKTAEAFSVTPQGDLVVVFADKKQLPIRLSAAGDMSLACSLSQPNTVLR